MKKILKSIFLTSLSFFLVNAAFGSQILVGIFTKDIQIWRYWERVENDYKFKMIVFNTSDSTVELTMQQEVNVDDGMHFKLDTTKNKIYYDKLMIEENKYLIVEMPPDTNKDEYMIFVVNKKRIGVLSLHRSFPPKTLPIRKYCSDEGLNGGGEAFWISKNSLITHNMQIDSLFLHFHYNEKPYWSGEGIYLVVMRPLIQFRKFTVTLNNQVFGNYDYKGEYIMELPYHSEYDDKKKQFLKSNMKADIVIAFQVEKSKEFFLGLNSPSGINVLKKDETMAELRERMYPTHACVLPIMVQ